MLPEYQRQEQTVRTTMRSFYGGITDRRDAVLSGSQMGRFWQTGSKELLAVEAKVASSKLAHARLCQALAHNR